MALNCIGEIYASRAKAAEYALKNNAKTRRAKALTFEEELNYDPDTVKRLKAMEAARERAVEEEDFDEAKRLKAATEKLKSIGIHLSQLIERKNIAAKSDDFDSAKIIKVEIERLKSAIAMIQVGKYY